MTPLRFHKYEGLGNDFVVVERDDPLGSGEVVAICDRHFGIGADGVLIVAPPRSAGARASMVVENADGSRPEMCGNGLRCVALHLARADGASRASYVIDTDAGARSCVVDRDGDQASVLIDLGRASVLGAQAVEIDGVRWEFERVSMGNPHAIHQGSLPEEATVDRVGAAVSAAVPGGSNVEFVAPCEGGEFELVVWERGVGRTLACGTGAGATAVALATSGRASFDAPIPLHLPGGPLEVVVTPSLEVRLVGPARRVFEGALPGLPFPG